MPGPSFERNRFGRMKVDYRMSHSSTTDSEITYPNSGDAFPRQEDLEYLFLEEDSTMYVALYTLLAYVQGRLETDRDNQDRDQAHGGGAYRYEEGAFTVVSADRQQSFAEGIAPCERCCAAVSDETEHYHDRGPHIGAVR